MRFIQAYAAEGVPIWGVSVQNEPEATQRWDSCLYSAEEERDFVRDHLGPDAAQRAGLGAREDRDLGPQPRPTGRARQRRLLPTPQAAKYVWGAGFHWYGDDHFEQVQLAHDAWPDKHLLFTEGCQEGGPHHGSWELGERYARSMINDLNRWTVGWIDWNLLLDDSGGPNHVGNLCSAPILADRERDAICCTRARTGTSATSRASSRPARGACCAPRRAGAGGDGLRQPGRHGRGGGDEPHRRHLELRLAHRWQ